MALYGNKFSANAEDVETSIADWVTAGNGTVASSTTFAYSGTHSIKVTATAAGTTGPQYNDAKIAVTVGTVYTLTCWVYTTLAGRTSSAEIDWYNSGGTYISDTDLSGSPVPLVQNAWTPVTLRAAPVALSVTCIPMFLPIATTAGDVFYTDVHYFGTPTEDPVGPLWQRREAVSRASVW